MSSRSMTSIVASDLRCERQQRDVAGLLDRVGQTPLARSANARDAARHDLAPLGDECVQHLDVFVIDVVDLLDAEAAHFLAPEILLLLGEHRLVATGGTLRCAAWSSSGFCHCIFSLLKSLPYGRGSVGCGWRGISGVASGVPSICAATDGCAGAGAAVAFRCARFSRCFLRLSSRFSVSSMRTVRNLITESVTRRRRSSSFTVSGAHVN